MDKGNETLMINEIWRLALVFSFEDLTLAFLQEQVETPMLNSSIIPRDFINAVALNIYHDGSEGIQNHYDDSKRFAQPIISLRLFSDSRLSFGTQLYG